MSREKTNITINNQQSTGHGGLSSQLSNRFFFSLPYMVHFGGAG